MTSGDQERYALDERVQRTLEQDNQYELEAAWEMVETQKEEIEGLKERLREEEKDKERLSNEEEDKTRLTNLFNLNIKELESERTKLCYEIVGLQEELKEARSELIREKNAGQCDMRDIIQYIEDKLDD